MKIEFLCSNETVMEYFPPLPASKLRPDWYKDLPRYIGNHKLDAKEMQQSGISQQKETIKACIPVQDYIGQGYILRYPADIMVTPEQVGDEQGWWAASDTVKCSPHSHQQCPVHMNKKKNVYFKVTHPWTVRTPPGYSCYFYQPEFFLEERIRFFPGVVDTDTYPSPANFPGLILSEETFTLKAGDPMMVVFPFKRESWEHEVKYAEEKQNPVRLFIERGYKKLFHKQKSFR